jgi:hypothetical protein
MMPPMGRAMNPTANVLKEASSAIAGGKPAGEKRLGKDQGRGRAVQKEVVPFDAGAGQRGEGNSADRTLIQARRHGDS